MKSIRVSLIVYFLLLLAVAVGAASLLVYRNAAANLQAKQEADRKLLDQQHREDRFRIAKAFDNELERLAHEVARTAATGTATRSQDRFVRYLAMGLMSETQAHLFAHLWLHEAVSPFSQAPFAQRTVAAHVAWVISQDVAIDEDDLPHTTDPSERIYYQINSSWTHGTWNPQWQSASLSGHTLPFDRDRFDSMHFEPVVDEQPLPFDNRSVRRVMLKVPVRRPLTFPRRGQPPPNRFGPPSPGSRPTGGQRGNPQGRLPSEPRPNAGPGGWPNDPGVPYIVVHCAIEPKQRDSALAELDGEFERKLVAQDEAAREAMASLRRRLLLIGLGTFLATTLGGSLLVGLGLAPLRRLTDAVSRVSPRDFRLPLDPDESLPNELAPIRERLQQTLDDLRKAFEREKQASADISHELRTPVASILTSVEVALKKPRSAAEYRQTLEDCRTTARQMRHLVERLLALARLDAGSDRLRPRPVDVGELVGECATLVRPLAGERGLELRVHCPKPVTWTTDPDKLREVIVNLLHNAVQYNRPDGAIDVSAQADNGWLDVQVHDTGVGITPEAFGHIFERFYRADPSRSDSELHAGLGLSIVKGYVGLLGGTITVESQPGEGSTFRVRLPAAQTAA